jgi:hypothetical protein
MAHEYLIIPCDPLQKYLWSPSLGPKRIIFKYILSDTFTLKKIVKGYKRKNTYGVIYVFVFNSPPY